MSPLLNGGVITTFPVQPLTPSELIASITPPAFSPAPAWPTSNLDSSCPTIKSVNLEESNRMNSSLSTTTNMDRQLLRQKSHQKFSVMITKKLVIPEK